MTPETVSFDSWHNSLRLQNDLVELVVTTDVGPRIMLFKNHGRENVFKIFDQQLGGQHEEEWRIRGGHRFWVAPEDAVLSYHVDNQPVAWRQDLFTGEVLIESLQTYPRKLRKTLGIHLAKDSSKVTIRHVLTNEEEEPLQAAPWGLSVMRAGGLEIIPQPPLGEHPRDLLPNRNMVVWPYTDFSDPRWTFGQKFWLLRQAEDYPPTKIGLSHQAKWIAYVLDDCVFIKTIDYIPGAIYPDGGCNFETFSNSDMLEIESLAPVVTLGAGESATHFETWHLFPLIEEIQIESEESLSSWINSFLAQTDIA